MPNQIKYFIKLSARGFRRGLQTATRATRTFATKVKGLFKSVSKFILSPIGAIASLSVGFYKLFNAVSEGGKRFATLQREFANISTLLDGRLSNSVKNTIKDFAKLYGQESITLAKSYYDIVSAGITDQAKSLDILNSATKLAVAGYSDVKTTTSALLTVMEAYKDTNLSTTEAIDGMLGVIKFGRTTMDDFAGSVGRVLKLGSQAGVTFQEVTAMLSEMTKSGIETTEVVTQIRGVFASLVKVTPKQQKELQKLGIEWSVSAVKAKGFARVVQDLVKATKDLSDLETLGKIIPRVEGLSGFLNFAKTFPESLKRMADNVGLVDDSFKKVSGTQEEIQKRIQESINQLWEDESFAKFQTWWLKVKHLISGGIKEYTDVFLSFKDDFTLSVKAMGHALLTMLFRPLESVQKAWNLWSNKWYVDKKPPTQTESPKSEGQKVQQAVQAQANAEQKAVTQYAKLGEVKAKILKLTTTSINKMTEGIAKIRKQTERAVQKIKDQFFTGTAIEKLAQTRELLRGGDRRSKFERVREAGGRSWYTVDQELSMAKAIKALEDAGKDISGFIRLVGALRGANPKGNITNFAGIAEGLIQSPGLQGSQDWERYTESARKAQAEARAEGLRKEQEERQKFIVALADGAKTIVDGANKNLKATDKQLKSADLFKEAIAKFKESNAEQAKTVAWLKDKYPEILKQATKERKIKIELIGEATNFIQAKIEKSNQNNTLNRDAFADPNQQASTGP